MARALSHAAELTRSLGWYYAAFWLPLFATELVPLPATWRLRVRRAFHRISADSTDERRARELKIWYTCGMPRYVGERSLILRYLAGVAVSTALFFAPAIEMVRVGRAIRRYSGQASAHGAESWGAQFAQMLALDLREPETFGLLSAFHEMPMYYGDWMFVAEHRRRSHLYYSGFPGVALAANLLALKPERLDLRDPMFFFSKIYVEQKLRRAAVPTPRLLVVAGRGEATCVSGDDLPKSDLFEKPNIGKGGLGAVRWTYRDSAYHSDRGERQTGAQLLERWRRTRYRVVIQQRLANHPEIEAIGGPTLQTLRIHTVLDENGEPVPMPDAFLKLATGKQVVDNVHAGALAAPIDPGNGRLAAALTHDFDLTDRHPDTGAVFAGRVVPYWQEAVDLAVRAHRAFLPAVLIGFDIAVLADGPIVIEANSSPVTSDHLTRVPMSTIREMDLLLHHLEKLGGA